MLPFKEAMVKWRIARNNAKVINLVKNASIYTGFEG